MLQRLSMPQGIQILCLEFLRYFVTRINKNGNLRDFTLRSAILILYTYNAEASMGICQNKPHYLDCVHTCPRTGAARSQLSYLHQLITKQIKSIKVKIRYEKCLLVKAKSPPLATWFPIIYGERKLDSLGDSS